jgi:predicted NBD/HSP70 family sugar kinase
MKNRMKIICFDIGGTKILKAVVEIGSGKFEFLEIEEEKNPRKEAQIKSILKEYGEIANRKFNTKKIAI